MCKLRGNFVGKNYKWLVWLASVNHDLRNQLFTFSNIDLTMKSITFNLIQLNNYVGQTN